MEKVMPYESFLQWLQTSSGQNFLNAELSAIKKLTELWSGNHALLLGEFFSTIKNCGNFAHFSNIDFEALNKRLPYDDGSFNVIFLPHILQYHSEPELLLKEMTRLLQPEGHLLITGLNPYGSILGYKRWLFANYTSLREGHYLSAKKIKDYLEDFNVLKQSYFAGWPYVANGYIITAQFREINILPLVRKKEWIKAPGLVNRVGPQ